MERGKILQHPPQLPGLPIGLTSFGAVCCNNAIFVWGGHCGAAHEYYREGQNRWLFQLDLERQDGWQRIHESATGRQGLALVAYQNQIYRVGGFEARNSKQQDQDLHSVAYFEVFDWDNASWRSLSHLPESRSSFDAVIIEDQLFVAGGWSLSGNDDVEWLTDAHCIDLSQSNPTWETVPAPPFRRRAISTATQDGKLYVIGGMQMNGGPTRQVSIFDPQTGVWSAGPSIPGEDEMEGFGTSSFNVGGQICLTTYSGKIFQLSPSGSHWTKLGQLAVPRFFHQLTATTNREFAVLGGANHERGKTKAVELLQLPHF